MRNMFLFSMEEVHELNLKLKFPDTTENYIKHIIEEVPLGRLKIDSLTERNDRIFNLMDLVPQYDITGNDISLKFLKSSLSIDLGSPFIPPEIEKVMVRDEDQEPIFTKDFLNKFSIDVTYLLGVITSFIDVKNESIQVSGVLELRKEKDIDLDFSKTIQSDTIQNIDEDLKVTGILLKYKNEEEWSYYIRNVEGALAITNRFKFNLLSSFDIYEIIEKYMLKLNNILLNI